jgi:hypothetical protein
MDPGTNDERSVSISTTICISTRSEAAALFRFA